MKPPQFSYHAPGSVDEALSLLAELEDAKPLAGGQSLIPLLNLRLARPAHLVDLARTGLGGIGANGVLRIGAMTRQRDVERDATVQDGWPLLPAALSYVGHPPIRNRGTIGGSIAHADPAAELPAVMMALDASFVARSVRGERVVPAREFFVSVFETALAPDELVVEIRVPRPAGRTGWSIQEVARRHGDFALVGGACTITLSADGTISGAALAFSGVGPTPHLADLGLDGERPSDAAFAAAAARATEGLRPPADLHGSSAYRQHLAKVVARRCLREATDRTGGSS